MSGPVVQAEIPPPRLPVGPPQVSIYSVLQDPTMRTAHKGQPASPATVWSQGSQNPGQSLNSAHGFWRESHFGPQGCPPASMCVGAPSSVPEHEPGFGGMNGAMYTKAQPVQASGHHLRWAPLLSLQGPQRMGTALGPKGETPVEQARPPGILGFSCFSFFSFFLY